MNSKLAYGIGFLVSVGYIGLVTFAPDWLGGLINALFFIAALTFFIGTVLSSGPGLPKIKGESDDHSA